MSLVLEYLVSKYKIRYGCYKGEFRGEFSGVDFERRVVCRRGLGGGLLGGGLVRK